MTLIACCNDATSALFATVYVGVFCPSGKDIEGCVGFSGSTRECGLERANTAVRSNNTEQCQRFKPDEYISN